MNKTINNQRYESVIQWLVLARKKKGLTIRQFAELIDEPHQFVNRVEKCQRKLNIYEYVQYCEALNLNPEDGLKLLK
ncbi:MAG: helix-turn-helix transcriptional regulator [Pseudomonadota bacterium]|nr:helix-turn-helix transcriptional regulator [Pseudomonadota bacterium]